MWIIHVDVLYSFSSFLYLLFGLLALMLTANYTTLRCIGARARARARLGSYGLDAARWMMIDTIARGRRVYDRHYIVYAASAFQVATLPWAFARARADDVVARVFRDRNYEQ